MSKFIWVFHFDKFCPEFILDEEDDAYLSENLLLKDETPNFLIFKDIDHTKVRLDMRSVKYCERILTSDCDYEDD